MELVYSFYDSTIIFHHKQTKQRRWRSGSSARDMSRTFITSLTKHDVWLVLIHKRDSHHMKVSWAAVWKITFTTGSTGSFLGRHPRTTSSNVVGHNMLSSFKHHVGQCWIVLEDVGWSLISVKLFIQHLTTSVNIFIRACALTSLLVDIHWYPIYQRRDPRRQSIRIKNRHFVWSLNFAWKVIEYSQGKILFSIAG